jgi:membrane associated rhomboid family serine protease
VGPTNGGSLCAARPLTNAVILIPIRTESVVRRTPHVNYLLIAANFFAFLLFNERFMGKEVALFASQYLSFHSDEPAFYQFFTYQFVHAGAMHLLGNMLFLWVFGNGVNGKMGDWPYLLFYLGGGVFAAWGYAFVHEETFRLVGASGAVAAITTAYLALFPRSRVTILVWLIFIYFFEVSAMIIIGLKIIAWDNIIAPGLSGSGNVAHQAHLAGYLFGFAGALGMLWLRALPRDQFDILALWKRWYRRREFAAATARPAAAAQARYGSVARVDPPDPKRRAIEEQRADKIADLRGRVGEALERRDMTEAVALYEQLSATDPQQCLSERQQLEIARELYSTNRFPQAAAAFERLVECYPNSGEAGNVRLLLGIIYARDLREYETADKHLTQIWETLRDDKRRDQCFEWLKDVRAALGRPAPENQHGSAQ